MRVGVALTTVLFLFSLVLAASSQKTTITVEVKNQYDKPVDNAAVILDFLGSHQITKLGMRKAMHWEARTNQQGIAHFPPVPYGTVQVQVITKKYQTFGEKFDVDTEEKRIDVKLNSPQQQYSAHPPLKPADPPK
ncbi:MAG: hypothetical protein JO185_00020 [Acidobacteriaceae bacterium]|nr:hypothetical protein [Acidobacteriaceae bacterium]